MISALDHNYFSGEIRLWRSARKDKTVGVVVEAKSDELLFQKLFSSETTFFSVNGFQNVLDVVKDVHSDLPYIVGIIDADFRHCDKKPSPGNNIFLTDHHDVEMMMVNSMAWAHVIGVLTQKHKLKNFEKEKACSLLDHLLTMSHKFSCVRYLNHTNKLGLVFKTWTKGKYSFLDYSKILKKDTFEIDMEKLLLVLENKSQKQGFFKNHPEFIEVLSEICTKSFDLFDFCNGHDFLNLLLLALKKEIGNINLSGEEIEKYFIVAYRFTDFEKTKLFETLKMWETKTDDIILFNDIQSQ